MVESFWIAAVVLLAPVSRSDANAGTVPLEEAQEEESPEERAERERAEKVANAVSELRAAEAEKEPRLRVAAITRWRELAADEVARAIGAFLRDGERDVRVAAIEALRFLDTPRALEELHGMLRGSERRAKELRADHELFALVLKAIGQHADPASIPLLSERVAADEPRDVLRVRVLGLGNIRSTKALEALFELLDGIDGERRGQVMTEFRLSLMRLTAVDHGVSAEAWREWWRKEKRGFAVTPEAPRLPDREQYVWDTFWGNEPDAVRDRRREKRGDDPERGSR